MKFWVVLSSTASGGFLGAMTAFNSEIGTSLLHNIGFPTFVFGIEWILMATAVFAARSKINLSDLVGGTQSSGGDTVSAVPETDFSLRLAAFVWLSGLIMQVVTLVTHPPVHAKIILLWRRIRSQPFASGQARPD